MVWEARGMKGRWRLMTYFTLGLPNQPGQLARFADQLHAEGINLLGLWGYTGAASGPQLSCVPQIPDAFRRWARGAGLVLEEGKTLYLFDDDRPGALVETLDRIAAGGINVTAIECVASGQTFGWFLWAEPDQMDALEDLLL
jgi:prephenate dehydratase